MKVAQVCFEKFRENYNHYRPHEALGLDVPARRYRVSGRTFSQESPPIIYAGDELVRRVKSKGEITFQNRFYFIGRAFSTHVVVLRPYKRASLYRVCFGAICLGYIDHSQASSKPKSCYLPLLARASGATCADGQGVVSDEVRGVAV